MSDSKTEKATPKKREDERKKGNVFVSKDIMSVVSLFVITYTLKLLFPTMYAYIHGFIYKYAGIMEYQKDISIKFTMEILMDFIIAFCILAMPALIVSSIVAIVVTGVQTKFIFSMQALKPKFSRLSPLQGAKRLFSMRSFVEVLKGTIKLTIIGYILYDFFISKISFYTKTLDVSVLESSIFIFESIVELVINILLIFIFIAGLDYMYQWWEYEKQLKMSKHDIKEEYKQMEGDPQVKSKIKQMQQKRATQRMMEAIPTSDVVIRNPTHYAVALRYDLKKDNAPTVVAKGKDELALRIVKVADEAGVYTVENKEMTRAIYNATNIGDEIPLEYYNTVAELLALVYKIKNKEVY